MTNVGSRIDTGETSSSSVRESNIDIEVVIFNIVRNWWMILIGCIIAAMAAYMVVTERYTPRYHAAATFVVSSKDNSSDPVYSTLVVASKLAESLTYVFESPVLRQKVAESLDMPAFNGTITATFVENTNLIQLGVDASSPQLAFDEMCAIIKYHHIVSDNIMGNAVMDVLKAPTVPTEPVASMNRPSKVLTAALATGLAITILLVVSSVVSDEIMTENDLVTRVDCPPLATIFHERKNLSLRARLQGVKTSMLITNPTTSFRFAETYRLFRTRLEYLMRQKNYKVLMVSSALENEGKTTSAANTAITLALNNKRVLLMDGDMLKPALYKAMSMKITRGKSIDELIKGNVDMNEIPTYEGLPTLSLLLGKSSLSNSTEIIASKEMKDFLDKARDYFDYIVIDTPPIALATDAECFAEIADCMLLVIKQGGTRAKRINECLDSISQSGVDILGCIFNNVYPLDFLNLSSKKHADPYRPIHGDPSRSGYGYGSYGSYGSYGNYGSYGHYGNYGGYGGYGSGYLRTSPRSSSVPAEVPAEGSKGGESE